MQATQESPVTVVAPVVNLNGTAKSSLIEENYTARRAVSDAYDALQNACPHPRNFPGREGQYQLARTQHVARLEALDKMGKELDSIIMQIDDQGK